MSRIVIKTRPRPVVYGNRIRNDGPIGKFTTQLVEGHSAKPSTGKAFVILTACYNKRLFITECIKSVMEQDYRPILFACIDDCSTDGSLKQILSVKEDMKKSGISFSIYRNDSRAYCSNSYIKLLSYCRGDYYGVLDADDMLMPGAPSFIADIYEKNPQIAYIWTQFQICDQNMVYKKTGISSIPPPGKSFLGMGRQHAFSHWRTFSNRIDAKKVFRKDLASAVDKDMGYNLEELGTGMFVDKECYMYREGIGGSICSTYKPKARWTHIMKEAQLRRAANNIIALPTVKWVEP